MPVCKTGKGHCRRFTFDITQAPRQLRFNDNPLPDFEEVKFSQVNPEQPHKMSMETSHYEYSNFFQPEKVGDAFKTKAKDEWAQALASDQEEEKSFSVDSDENSIEFQK